MNLDALVAPLRADVVSGAAVVGRTAAEVVRRTATRVPAESQEEFTWALADLATRVLDAQPAMAPLVTLTSLVLTSAGEADDLEDARDRVTRAVQDFRDRVESAASEVARHAAALIPAEGTRVMTLSNSSTVRAALERAVEDGAPVSAVCLESRPASEGKREAERLASEGVAVTYAVDAAAGSLIEGCDLVVLGADSIGDLGVVNKIGSRAVALLAHRANIPVYVLADRTKLLPPGFPQPVDDDRPTDEVWRAVPGVRIWNRYFESLPLDWVSAVITESGRLGPDEVQEARSSLPVPDALRDWARRRLSDGPRGPTGPV